MAVRVELSGKNWSIYKIEPGLEGNWRDWNLKAPIFSIPITACLSKDKAIEAWLRAKHG
jgi:hypothetical protein